MPKFLLKALHNKIKYFFWLCIFTISGCANLGAVQLSDLNYPLNDLQRISISVLPLGKRFESLNGREYKSEYFQTKKGEFENSESQPIRTFVQVTILGDRRPYKIEVRAPVERRNQSGQYELVKYDEGMAKVISRRIKSALHKRRDDRNIIDEFRVF